ncbi:MAG: GNAT family N-acetyltransferase [Actinomycetota bacterium]|nr:GNAT family N-acetyltransferase [Actinomycetota bacterium]
MGPLLDDPGLHTYISGEPATATELRTRYQAWAAGGSADGLQVWLNWIVRRRDNGQAVGTVQATVSERDGALTADVAWVIGSSQQGQGYARESAQAMANWLRQEGVEVLIAYVHPEHQASMAVARAIGLARTELMVDGEVVWRWPAPAFP